MEKKAKAEAKRVRRIERKRTAGEPPTQSTDEHASEDGSDTEPTGDRGTEA